MWEQLYPALQYLSIRQLSLFDRELIKSELIGIAEEAEIQGARLDRKMGMPYQAFCDFLIEKRGIERKKRCHWRTITGNRDLLYMVADVLCSSQSDSE